MYILLLQRCPWFIRYRVCYLLLLNCCQSTHYLLFTDLLYNISLAC